MTLISCKSKEIINSENIRVANNSFFTDYKKEVVSEETFVFNITNNSDDTLTILSPSVAFIEKLDGEVWKRIRILYCPCGANCIAPPKEKMLSNGQNHEYKWNLKESWCGEEQENGIPETIVKSPQCGIYRIKVDYILKGKKEQIVKQFELKLNN
jgi:hypothetical protein